MSIIKKGTPFGATEQVTSDKLNNLVDNASFTDTSANAVAYTGSTGTCLNGGGLEVTSAGQLQIEDDGVTPAKTNFINHTTGAMTLSGTTPKVIFSDDDATGKLKPEVTGSSDNGNLAILTKESESELYLQCSDNMIFETTDNPANDYDPSSNDFQPRLMLSHNAGKDQDGNAVAGAKVTGGLYVTGDVYADDYVVADNFLVQGSSPKITFTDTDVSTTSPYINGNSSNGSLEIKSSHGGSDIFIDADDLVLLRHQGDNIFAVSDTVAKDASGSDASGAQVTGSLEVTQDVYVTGTARAAAIKIGNDDILDLIHPVGSVISTTTNYANSAAVVAKYGGTTWTRFSEGQFAVGYSTTDSDFSAGATGGAKDVTLTEAQVPNIDGSISIDAFINSAGDFTSTGSPSEFIDTTGTAGPAGSSNRATLNFGGGGSHENLPPYKVVYMWTRTA